MKNIIRIMKLWSLTTEEAYAVQEMHDRQSIHDLIDDLMFCYPPKMVELGVDQLGTPVTLVESCIDYKRLMSENGIPLTAKLIDTKINYPEPRKNSDSQTLIFEDSGEKYSATLAYNKLDEYKCIGTNERLAFHMETLLFSSLIGENAADIRDVLKKHNCDKQNMFGDMYLLSEEVLKVIAKTTNKLKNYSLADGEVAIVAFN